MYHSDVHWVGGQGEEIERVKAVRAGMGQGRELGQTSKNILFI